MERRILLVFATLLALSQCLAAYHLDSTRDEMLAYYYSNIDSKIPRMARLLLGDERINVEIGGQVLGIVINDGRLSSFELSPLSSPSITVSVSDHAAEEISARRMGILSAIESGEIKISSSYFFSGMKIEAVKRVYSVSKLDEQILSSKSMPKPPEVSNSFFIHRAKIVQ